MSILFFPLHCSWRERRREGRRERDKYWCKREISMGCLLYSPRPGIESTILTMNQTCNLSAYGMTLQPTNWATLARPSCLFLSKSFKCWCQTFLSFPSWILFYFLQFNNQVHLVDFLVWNEFWCMVWGNALSFLFCHE